jgi:hypothetical protein
MKKYKCIHSCAQRTRAQWLHFFAKHYEYGDLEPKEKFDEFVRNGDLQEITST